LKFSDAKSGAKRKGLQKVTPVLFDPVWGVELDGRGNVKGPTEDPRAYHTFLPSIFAAGDMRRGQSLVVWAIREGRQCARAVDE